MELFLSSGKSAVPQKYTDLRSEIKNGDMILYKGSSIMSKAIQYFDKAYYNHIGVVWIPEKSDRVLTLDMWSQGLACSPLSRRMSGYNDFCILRPNVSTTVIDAAIKELLGKWDGADIKYDYTLLFRIALIKKTGIDITGLGKVNHYICSEFAQQYTDIIGLDCFKNINLITPEDFRRYKDKTTTLIYDDAPPVHK